MASASNTFAQYKAASSGSYGNAFAVTPHDTNEQPFVTRGIYVGTAGHLKVTTVNGDTVVFTTLSAGVIHPISAKIIWSAGTTALTIIGLY